MRRGRLAWLLLGLLGCEQPAEPPAERSAGSGIAVRIVSLHDVTTEMLVELGALPRVVGIAPPVDAAPHIERAVAAIPRVGGLESIMAQRPSVVLGLGVVAEREPEMVARLRDAGIDVQLGDPAVLDDVYALARTVARRAQVTAQGEKLVAALRARMEGGVPRAAAQRKRVFVYDCCDPPFTAGGKTVLSDLIARAGGRNVFADLDADWTHVSWEQVLARQPELIVIHAYRYDGQGDVSEKRKALSAIPGLSKLPVVVMPLGCSLGGLRSAEGFELLRAGIEGRS